LPWSQNHSNSLLGKETTVDMAKAMQWVEQKMQAELGPEGGQLFFSKDIPGESVEQYIENSVMQQVEAILAEDPWIEVPLLGGGGLPDEAWEEVEILDEVEVEETVTEYEIDWDSARVVSVPKTRTVTRRAGTGRFMRQLKSSYELREDGRLYRQRTVNDISPEDISIPILPDWILDRIPDGRNTLSEWRSSDAKVKQVLARAEEEQEASQLAANVAPNIKESSSRATAPLPGGGGG
jgi:hypothetical protein